MIKPKMNAKQKAKAAHIIDEDLRKGHAIARNTHETKHFTCPQSTSKWKQMIIDTKKAHQ